MFKKIGEFVSRTAIFWIVFWLALFAISWALAPSWSDVASEGDLQHLPDDMPTRVGHRFYDKAFPNEQSNSSIVLVLVREEGPLQVEDFAFVANVLTPQMLQLADEYGGVMEKSLKSRLEERLGTEFNFGVGQPPQLENAEQDGDAEDAEAPTADEDPQVSDAGENGEGDPAEESGDAPPRFVSIDAPHNSVLGPLLVSEDGQAMLVYTQLTSNFITTRNMPIVADVETLLKQLRENQEVPEGLNIRLTGSAVIGRDVISAINKSTRSIERWTIWIVIGFLLLVFRAPLASMIPLATVFCAIQISLHLLAQLAWWGWLDLFDGLQVYLTVLLYGVGVDFALFLVARHQEELERGATVRKAIVTTMDNVGLVILVSAGTQIAGVAMLAFADFGKFEQAGYTIPIGLAVTLLAALTLTFGLLRLVGRWGFWPLKLSSEEARERYQDRDPLRRNELAQRIWYKLGQWQHAHPLLIFAGTLAVLAPLVLVAVADWGNVTYDMTRGLPEDAPSLQGNEILQEKFSNGITAPVTVLLRNPEVDFRTRDGIRYVEDLSKNLTGENGGMQVADIRSLANPLGVTPRVRQRLDMILETVPDGILKTPGDGELVTGENDTQHLGGALEILVADAAMDYYVSSAEPTAGSVTRMSLVVDADPLRQEQIVAIDQWHDAIRQALPPELQDNTEVFLLGPTATLNDVSTVADADRQTIFIAVTLAVLVVLVILLRQVIIPTYLVAAVFLSYLITLGATRLMTMWMEGDQYVGLDWTVPMLTFTLLMAVGSDYNVLLVQRFTEEKRKHELAEAMKRSMAASGGRISAAGLILAGTFSALLWGGEMDNLKQLGFALSLGVLIDTFVVRPLLIPPLLLWTPRLKAFIKSKFSSSAEHGSPAERPHSADEPSLPAAEESKEQPS